EGRHDAAERAQARFRHRAPVFEVELQLDRGAAHGVHDLREQRRPAAGAVAEAHGADVIGRRAADGAASRGLRLQPAVVRDDPVVAVERVDVELDAPDAGVHALEYGGQAVRPVRAGPGGHVRDEIGRGGRLVHAPAWYRRAPQASAGGLYFARNRGGRLLAALDIGNTNVTVGIFDGEEVRATWRLATDIERLTDEYAVTVLGLLEHAGIDPRGIREAIIASVVPDLVPVFEQLCKRYFGVEPMVVDTGTRTGVRILYDNPRDVGADRIVDVVAALRLYGPPPLIIVDFGTATVFDAVSADGEYMGGAIAPGIGIASEALFERAAKLHRVELERPKAAIGKNTVAAIQSGTLYGYVGLLEGMVARFKKELGGKARVIATGGWAPLLAKETRVFDAVDPNLTLTGLRILHQMQQRSGRD